MRDKKLEEILLKRDRAEKLSDYEKMVLLFEAARNSCNHPHTRSDPKGT